MSYSLTDIYLPLEVLDVEDRAIGADALVSILGVLDTTEANAKTTGHLVLEGDLTVMGTFILFPTGNHSGNSLHHRTRATNPNGVERSFTKNGMLGNKSTLAI